MVTKQLVFVDESSSLVSEDRFFCVAAFISGEDIEVKLEKALRNIRERVDRKKHRTINELKFNVSDEKTRIAVLQKANELVTTVFAFAINKGKQKVADVPVNYAKVIRYCLKKIGSKPDFIIDKKYTNKNQNTELISYISEFKVELKDSQTSAGLQIVDFIAGALNLKLNFDNSAYYDIFLNKTTLFNVPWWKIKTVDPWGPILTESRKSSSD